MKQGEAQWRISANNFKTSFIIFTKFARKIAPCAEEIWHVKFLEDQLLLEEVRWGGE